MVQLGEPKSYDETRQVFPISLEAVAPSPVHRRTITKPKRFDMSFDIRIIDTSLSPEFVLPIQTLRVGSFPHSLTNCG